MLTNIVTSLMLALTVVSCQTMLDTHNVLSKLMTNYDKRVRPATDQSQPVYVNVSLNLIAIQEFDEVSEKLSIVAVLNLAWHDERMTWNFWEYNNTYGVNVPMGDVWTPRLVLTNPINKIKVVGEDWVEMKWYFNGMGYLSVGDVIHSKCNVDVSYFPWDTQTCEIMFIPWGQFQQEVYMVSTLENAETHYYSPNGEWHLTGTSASAGMVPGGDFSYASFGITITRRPTFFLVNVILPIIFMGFLNVLVFVLPVQSGERISYAITVLLAIAVFLTLVGDNMPKTSEPMSSLCFFLLANLVLSAVICLGTIFNMMLYYRDENADPPSPAVAGVTRVLLCKKRHDVTKIRVMPQNSTEISVISKAADDATTRGTDARIPEKNFINWMNDGISTERDVTWKDVSRAMDRVFGVTASIWLVVTSVSFMVMIAMQKSFAP